MIVLVSMNTIHIDEKHNRLLERLLARLASAGTKMNKEKLIDQLIEDVVIDE